MSEPIVGKTIRVPRQMVAEWDGCFEAARAEIAERHACDPELINARQVWAEIIVTLTQRYMLGEQPLRSEGIEAKLDLITDFVAALADHAGVPKEAMYRTPTLDETEQDDS